MEEKVKRLHSVVQKIAACRQCSLVRGTTNAVPGEGNPQTKIIFIGEGPGFNEDRLGRPFVGQAGKLLDSLLSSIKLKREDVFITNVVKHRPPENRDPLPQEIEACRGFLDEQINIIDPKIIVTLGRFSLNKFLPGEYISHVHGQARFVDFAGRQRIILPMYHPAAALRNGSVMTELEKDFQKIIQFQDGVEISEKKVDDKMEQLSLIN